jgi:hypothetical protein
MIRFIIAVTALLIASTAHAEEPKWHVHRTCHIYTTDPANTGEAHIIIMLEDALEIQKLIPVLRKCDAFYKCVADRDAGKVKHCYANDRRWR